MHREFPGKNSGHWIGTFSQWGGNLLKRNIDSHWKSYKA